MTRRHGPQLEQLWAVAAAGRWVAIGGARKPAGVTTSTVHLFDPTGRPASSGAAGAIDIDAAVRALAMAHDDLLVVGTERGQVLAYALGDGEPQQVAVLDSHQGAVRALATDRMKTRLWSVGDDGVVVQYALDGATPSIRGRRSFSDGALYAVAIDEDDRWLAVGGADGQARIVDADAFEDADVRGIAVGEGELHSLAFTTDGRLVGGGGDGSIRVVYLEGAPDEEDRSGDAAHAGAVRALVFGPPLRDEADRPLPRRLFSVGDDGALKSWQLDTKRRPKTLELARVALRGLAWWAPPIETVETNHDQRGGRLLTVDANRRLTIVGIDKKGALDDDSRTEVDGALSLLTANATSSNARGRQQAIARLAELPEEEAREAIERSLAEDKTADIRAFAAEKLGASDRRKSRAALRAALNDQEAVRTAALAALDKLETDDPLAAVRAGLGSKHADIREVCTRRLPGLRAVSPLVPGLVAEGLADKHAKVRNAALDALYALHRGDAVEPTRVALTRPAADVREAALERLARSGAASGPEGLRLLEVSLDDDERAVRRAAFVLLVGTRPALMAQLRGAYGAFDQEVRALEGETPFLAPAQGGAAPVVVTPASADDGASESVSVVIPSAPADATASVAPADAAGTSAERPAEVLGDDDRQPLFAALACRHADTALRGATMLATIADPRSIGALLQLSREPAFDVRKLALEGLIIAAAVFEGDDRIRARIEWMLSDPQMGLRTLAFNGLLSLAGEDKTARLTLAQLALGAGPADVRARGLALLVGEEAPYKDEPNLQVEADRLLGDALDDEAEEVRSEAFSVLWSAQPDAPERALRRAARSRQADVRRRVVTELERRAEDWAEPMLIALVGDSASEVGQAAYKALLKTDANKRRSDIHLAALTSPRPDVRAKGCVECVRADAAALRTRLYELIDESLPAVHLKAIEAADALLPDDPIPYARAFESVFFELRVRAAELLGRRRKPDGIRPMRDLLTIPPTHFNRPSEVLRQRAAGAIADVGDPSTIPFLVSLLDDDDPRVRENAGRGLATACRADDLSPLVDALAHGDLPVRSWAAEGLARMGDTRAIPVLAGTLEHTHRPIREGAVIGFVALGPDGVRGLLQALEDPDRTLQDLALGIIVARDIALVRAGLAPDLLLSALAAAHPEIRYAAARVLETRTAASNLSALARGLVGPLPPEKAADTKDWPPHAQQNALLNVLVGALASDNPTQRYAAARVLARRNQPKAFWREAERLVGPSAGDVVPRTGWDDEVVMPRKRDWIRRLFRAAPRRPQTPPPRTEPPETTEPPKSAWVRRLFGDGGTASQAASGDDGAANQAAPDGGPSVERPAFGTPPVATEGVDYRADVARLVFGTYAGLVRQAPPSGDADETHRVRRDSVTRLSALAAEPDIGRSAALPVLRRALSDPHHLVRRAAMQGLRSLYPEGAVEPLGVALTSTAADIGRLAVDELVDLALAGDPDARGNALQAIDAPVKDVRAHALGRLPRLYGAGSLEPWFLALESKYADIRLAVVERLIDAPDARVTEALGRALESDHEDLRLKATLALAKQGDLRTLDVLVGFLRAEDEAVARKALAALVGFAKLRDAEARQQATGRAAQVIAARIDDDPDATADRKQLLEALGRLGSAEGVPTLVSTIGGDDANLRSIALSALFRLATDSNAPARRYPDGARRKVYREPLLLDVLPEVIVSPDVAIRTAVAEVLGDFDDRRAEALLTRLLDDRDATVRAAAAEQLARRIKYVSEASVAPLARALRTDRRELVLPAALGLAERHRADAFKPLMLVFKAGLPEERQRAVLGLGTLGDARVLEELYRLVEPDDAQSDEDRALAPAAAEAFGAVLPSLVEPDARTRARETLDRLARQGPKDIREGAFAGLRRAGDDASRMLLESIVADGYESSAMRRSAVRALARLKSPASEQVLADVLNADDRRLRQDALVALRMLMPKARTKISLLALQSKHADIAQPAALLLARRGDPETLVRRFDEIKDARVRRRVRKGLQRRRAYAPSALPPLLDGALPASRAEAAWLAGASGDASLGEAVLGAAARSADAWRQKRHDLSTDDDLRAEEEAWLAALWAAGRIGVDAGPAARAILDDRSELPAAVRTQALRYLGGRGQAEDAGVVERQLSAEAAVVRRAAAAALASLAPERGVAVLETASVADPSAIGPLVEAAWSSAGQRLFASTQIRPLVLPRLLGQANVAELIDAARVAGEAPARLAAIAALGRAGGYAAAVERADEPTSADGGTSASDAAMAFLTSLLAESAQPDAVRAAAFKALRRIQRAKAAQYDDGPDRVPSADELGAGSPEEAYVANAEDEASFDDDDDETVDAFDDDADDAYADDADDDDAYADDAVDDDDDAYDDDDDSDDDDDDSDDDDDDSDDDDDEYDDEEDDD